ncbi:MAG: MATE family efflux transporter, partial [Candidatus Eisenbacteria bacterium]|nr:MATE family efflux transporter [Candidatus Eisenbacteria bacterium]
MVFGIVGMQGFNLADTYFVGRLGTNELAAISFTFPVVFVIAGLALGLGMGTSAVVSRAIGEGDRDKTTRLATDGLVLALLIVAVLVTIGLLTIDPLFRALGAGGDVLPLVRRYMSIWYFGMIFVVVPMVGNNAIRATGDTLTPSIIMLIAVGMNFLLDPLLIFGIGPFPRLEIAGAALATVCSRAVTFSVALWVLSKRERMISLRFPGLAAVWSSWRRILFIGVPLSLSNILIPVGIGVITRLVSAYGPPAVAAFGVATRVETLSLTVIMALRSVMSPFVGQNWGAGRFGRLRRGIRLANRFAFFWGVGAAVVLAVIARPVAGAFSENPEVIERIIDYLWIVPASYGFRGILLLSST